MTRKEQIENFANSQVDCEFFDEKIYNSILLGAKWADEHPKEGLVSIDKVCEYLDNVLYEVVSGISGLPDVMSIENTTMEDFIKNFRKAMENYGMSYLVL